MILGDQLSLAVRGRVRRWFVTGAAGFIGSHLVENLLGLDQVVVGLDNFRTGRPVNLADVQRRVAPEQWERFRWREGDILEPDGWTDLMTGIDVVLHQAAIGSVPYSIEYPGPTHATNVTGFLNVLEAARGAGVAQVVYASSSAVYGDSLGFPAREDETGQPLSPYAATKAVNEVYAAAYGKAYGLSCVGLRYFNVFGRRQDPAGEYAAVLPRWVRAMCAADGIVVFGDGETTRDFCPVQNVVEANLRAALRPLPPGAPRVFNVGLGRETSLNQLRGLLAEALRGGREKPLEVAVRHEPFRDGDVRRSCADIERIRAWLDFRAPVSLEDGIRETVGWFANEAKPPALPA